MSQKITSKNLSYSSSLPPFLAALHAHAAGASSGPDPLAAGQRRSAKKRSSSEEAEDVPLVVDEQGNAMRVQLDRDGAVVPEAAAEGEGSKPEGAAEARDAEPKSAFGGRKRKVGRVVGGDGDAPDSASQKNDLEPAKKDGQKFGPPTGKKAGKKTKKIKLSFDQEEGEG
ncbi:hypothetical protein HRG_007493 [Hirsutella rhossiliensis]|uniref:DUF4604 domain-containing protein n=1 Tax=Hirsutella rhossiliensis TaxID=111463 RepID=A0A9P8SHD2_9HYPO|nr:uncharacterized protein HRG_07493 [Hirsutella rhossiliensis]KAH0961415.1 hypothetical protein HRG_07493 [Hirsutella rhossiliensis]